MVRVFVWQVTLACHLIVCGIANHIDCNVDKCQNTIINCKSNENCIVSCNNTQSCSGSMINCPTIGDCDIHCVGKYSCAYTIIDATLSIGNFNLLCDQSTDHCKKMKIYGSILDTNIAHFNISCNGKSSSCTNSEIRCPTTSNCSIACNAHTACKYTTVHAPNHGNLAAHCNGAHSCTGTLYNASKASTFNLTGCAQQASCSYISLYCPPHTNGIKHCFIDVDVVNEWNIYAVNGWNDIQMNTMDLNHESAMFCGAHYDTSCDIWNKYATTSDGTVDMDMNIDIGINIGSASITKSTNWRPSAAKILFGISVIVIIIIVGIYCFYKKRNEKEDKVSRKEWSRIQSESIADHDRASIVHDAEYDSIQYYTMDAECKAMEEEYMDSMDHYRLGTKARKSIVWETKQDDDCVDNIEGLDDKSHDIMDINPLNTDVMMRKTPMQQYVLDNDIDPLEMSAYIMQWQQETLDDNNDEDNMMIVTGNTMNNITMLYSSNDDEYDFSDSNGASTLKSLNGKAAPTPNNSVVSTLSCGYTTTKMEESETDVSTESLIESNDKTEVTSSIPSTISLNIEAESFRHSFDPAPTAC